MNTGNITRVRRLDRNTVLYSGSAYQSQGSSAAGHWIKVSIQVTQTLSISGEYTGEYTGKVSIQVSMQVSIQVR